METNDKIFKGNTVEDMESRLVVWNALPGACRYNIVCPETCRIFKENEFGDTHVSTDLHSTEIGPSSWSIIAKNNQVKFSILEYVILKSEWGRWGYC
ncbi:hypothetical protein AVEN_22904-1 [Araneus ventricosus]|uniref:Uncharacterized protein n=1 Tax=Araneus ventricosus TaxID=182803 RepID=A0A4Y2D6Q4_ARAVE|nr:hypothetical protein AVEN_22904-1 [Araneus ventricosus]